MAATAALSTHHPDANPGLQGDGLFDDPAVVNKQIYRLLGKLPTIAAATWRHRVGRPYNYPTSVGSASAGSDGENAKRSWTANFLKVRPLCVSVEGVRGEF